MDLGDLKVRVSADVSDVQKAVEQAARQGLQAAQQQAKTTEAALKGAANASTKLQESLSAISEYLADAGLNADEVAEAMAAIGGGATKAAEKATTAATAAKNIATPTKDAAKAADNLQKGFSLSGSTLLRAGAALAGVGLGINIVAGAARLVHDVIADVVQSQLDWERSLKTVSGLYGDLGSRVAAVATAQANQPGLLGTQQEFAQYALNASVLTRRYGLNPDQVNQLVTTGGRVAFATGMTDQAQREQLQAQILAAVNGENSLSRYGVYTDPESVARRLGFSGGQALNAFTPQEVKTANAAIVNQGLSAFADRANANQRAALDAVTAAQKAQDQAHANLQNTLESVGDRDPATGLPTINGIPIVPEGGGYGAAMAADNYHQQQQQLQQQGGAINGLAAIDQEHRVFQASQEYVRALADSKKVQEANQRALDELAKSADAAGAKLLSFVGSLEDSTSIAHAQLLAQAQGTVTNLSRSAVPTAGMGTQEIGAIARGTTFQAVLQNYFAQLAQGENTNPIQKYLEQQANTQGPGLENQRAAAQRALAQAPKLLPVENAIGGLQTTSAQLDLAQAKAEADLEQITLSQRERYVQLMRDTVELRIRDNEQQQQSVRASMDLVRAQQAALPAQYRTSDAQYQQNLAQALAKQRLARSLRGEDVSDLPSIDQLIKMNINGQLDEYENAPALVQAQHNVEREGRPAAEAAMAQSLTDAQVRIAELATNAENLRDIPLQTQYESDLLDVNRDQLTVQQELRDATQQLIQIMSNPPSGSSGGTVPGTTIDLANLIFGEAGGGDVPAPSTLPGARRGAF